MPDTSTITDADVQEAAQNFYNDFGKVMEFHTAIQEMARYSGRNGDYDAGLRDLIARQKELMFGLRSLYADVYELLTPAQRSIVFKWIVQATGELKTTSDSLGNLGIAPLIIVAGIIITAATATALVAWHRQISLQKQALEYQATLLPLVTEGKLPADVLKPATPTGISETVNNVVQVALVIALAFLGLKLWQTWQHET